jgi:hypothetical protein
MTTVCYRDGLLAFDSRITGDTLLFGQGVKGRMTKEFMAAAAGAVQDVQAFLDWVAAGYTEDTKKKFGLLDREVEIEGIVITKKGEVLCFDNRLYPYHVNAPFFAFGSGAHIALGAMAMGATAYKAVKIASIYDVATGGEIKVLGFKRKKPFKAKEVKR